MKALSDSFKRKAILDAYFAYSRSYATRDWDQMENWMEENMTMFGTAVDEVAFDGDQVIR